MQPEYWWSPYIPDENKGYDVWVVNIDGSNEKQLTDIPDNNEGGWLSPDGSKVIYTSYKKSSINVDETQTIEIWMMNEDGSDKKLLEKVNAGGIEIMEWNPDGSKIAFVTWVLRSDGFDRDIYTIDTSLSKIG
jgi:Tol biopolymer transport system component